MPDEEEPREYLHLGFRVWRGRRAELRPGFHLRSTSPPRLSVPGGQIGCELRSAGGEPLVFHECGISDPHAAAHAPYREYYEVLPWDVESRQVVFLNGDEEIGVFEVEETAPEFVVRPEVDVDARAERVVLRWETRHESLPVHHMVRFSTDGGRSWQALKWLEASTSPDRESTVRGEFTAELSDLSGGRECQLQVLASSGIRTSTALSGRFSLPVLGRRAYVAHPSPETEFVVGATILLCGTGFSAQYGSPNGEDISWSSDRDGFLGSGSELPVHTLTSGVHLLRMSVPDGVGGEAAATVRIRVL